MVTLSGLIACYACPRLTKVFDAALFSRKAFMLIV
jgi:hypothetical protein